MSSTKEKILDVAKDIFIKKWFSKSSTTEITKKAGISRWCLYHHFSSKDTLLEELVKREWKMMLDAEVNVFINPNMSVLEKFDAWLEIKKQIMKEKKSFIVKVMKDPKLSEIKNCVMKMMKNRIEKYLNILVEQWIKDKTFKIDFPKETIIMIILMHEAVFANAWELISHEDELENYMKAWDTIIRKSLGIK